MHYFDYNATAPMEAAARAAWLEVVDGLWANPSSPSRFAARAQARLEACRDAWAEGFGTEPSRVVFLGGATEANNAVFAHLAEQAPPPARVLVSAVEHPCVLAAAKRWFRGRVEVLPVDPQGRLEVEALEAALAREPAVALVAVMAANNETGVIQPLEAVGAVCRRSRTPWLCDAAQGVGKLPLEALPEADFLTFSGHKFGGPRGVAGLLFGPGQESFRGRVGGAQEGGHQAGTEDLAGIAAMTAAWQAQPAQGWSSAGRDALLEALSGSGFEPLGAIAPRLPNTLSVIAPAHRASRWLVRLDRRGWLISSGSACATGHDGPSHVLAAMGLPADQAERMLRISGGPRTPAEEWLELGQALQAVREELDADAAREGLTTVVDLDF